MQAHEWYRAEVVDPAWQAYLKSKTVSFNIVAVNGLVRVVQGELYQGQTIRERMDWVLTLEQAKAALRTVRAEGKPVLDAQGPQLQAMLDNRYWA